jgi:hypothetical protein
MVARSSSRQAPVRSFAETVNASIGSSLRGARRRSNPATAQPDDFAALAMTQLLV